MKKILLSLTLLCGLYTGLIAQTTGGPDSYGYIWRDNNDPNGPVYNWIDIINIPNSNQVKLLSDDNTVGPFPIGFSMHNYWYDDSVFYVGSNGYISFLNYQLSSPFDPIPTAGKLDSYIAGLVSDMNFSSTDTGVVNPATCWYYTTPGNDSLIVTYDSLPYWTPNNTWSFAGYNTFQIILSKADSSITIQYRTVTDSAYLTTGYLSTGIESAAGTIGLQHMFNVFPQNLTAVKYYYPSTTSYIVNDASAMWAENNTTGGIFLSANSGVAHDLNASVKNQGNQLLNPFNVTANIIRKPSNAIVLTNTVATDTLYPSQSQAFSFANTYTPTTPSTYVYSVTTNLFTDIVPSNNIKQCEYVVVDTTTTNQWLSFDDGNFNGIALSWLGGNGGAAMQITPPYYPCEINKLKYYIVNNVGTTGLPTGFSAMIYDDDGFGGTPITLLDSIAVDPNAVIPASWNEVILPTPITVSSGSVYVVWYMGGDGIQLGTNFTAPFSNRSFEILGTSFAIYRDRETQDLMINMNISPLSTIGTAENNVSNFVTEIYPNPASTFARVNYKVDITNNPIEYSIYSIEGKLLRKKLVPVNQKDGNLSLDISGISNGLYLCEFRCGQKSVTKRLNIMN